MSDRLEIKITGSNQASQAFQSVTRDAQQMGQSVEQAGTRGATALERFRVGAAAFGAATGAAAGLLSDFARAASEEEVTFARLEQSIVNTGRSYDQYSQAIDRAIARGERLSFADDQVAEGLAALATTTGDAQAALDNIGLAMDLARAKGMSLAAASELVGKVHEGNLGILSRYGIVLEEGATATEALALLQQRTAGQAEAYANTTEGSLDRIKNRFDNLTESIGAQTGELQTLLALMPGLTSAYSALGAVVGGLGGGPIVGAGLLAAGSGLFTYDLLTNPGGFAETIALQALLGGANLANFLLPGNPLSGVAGQYQRLLTSNDVEAAAGQVFYLEGDENPTLTLAAKLVASGIVPLSVGEGGSPTDVYKYVEQQAGLAGMSAGEYIMRSMPNTPYVFDPVSGQYMSEAGLQKITFSRNQMQSQQIGNAATSYVGTPGTDTLARTAIPPDPGIPGRMGPVANAGDYANFGNFNQAADDLRAYRQELERTYGAYAGLVEGMNSAHDAQTAFAATQNNLMAEQSVYTGQVSEYSGQLNALESAYDILTQRQADGVALSEQELDFLERYPDAYARLTGGVEDATIAAGMLALAYAENMEKGDQMNQALAGTTSATGELVDVIELLILSLDGVPEEVRTQIMLNNLSDYMGDINSYITLLNSIPRNIATTLTTTQYLDYVPGSATSPFPGGMHGGVLGYADGGVVARMAEAGAELLRFRDGGMGLAMTDGLYNVPRGTYVTPAPATKAALGRAGAASGGIHISGPVYVYPATPDIGREITSALMSEWRY